MSSVNRVVCLIDAHDLGLPGSTQDQVAPPMAGHGPVGGLGGPLRDQYDVFELASGASARVGVLASTAGTAGAQRLGELGLEPSTALELERL